MLKHIVPLGVFLLLASCAGPGTQKAISEERLTDFVNPLSGQIITGIRFQALHGPSDKFSLAPITALRDGTGVQDIIIPIR